MSVYLEVMNCLTAPHSKVNDFIKLSCQLIRMVNKKKIIISNKLRFKKLKFWSRTHCIVFAVLGNHYNSLSFKRKRRITLKLNSSSWFSLVSRRQNVQWLSRLNTVLMSWSARRSVLFKLYISEIYRICFTNLQRRLISPCHRYRVNIY